MCDIEYESTLDERGISVQYWIVFERRNRNLNKQSVRVDPTRRDQKEEEYRNITIRTFVGTSVPLATLTGG